MNLNDATILLQEILDMSVMKKYEIIYADPPWDYGSPQHTKGGKETGGAHTHYNVMSVKEMKELPIPQISSDNCLLFMWVTGPFMDQAIDLMKHWGFQYKQVAFVWDKLRVNPGAYTTTQTEFVLVGKKGIIPRPRGSRKEKQLIQKKRTKHSEKPDEVRSRIEAMFPQQSKIELFARKAAPNWNFIGDMLNGKIQDIIQ